MTDLKLVATRKSEQNEAVLDPWTGVHIGAGLAAGLMGMTFTSSMLLAVTYEFAEQAFERSDQGKQLFKTSGPEHALNAVADVVVFAAAWYLGNAWNQT